ncbi:MAG: hypothetical protein RL188_422 [Bacteroidota bacterium]|jgi:methylmalonyl-CoA mutase
MQKIRILTSTSLFDGHDASINIMRRVLQEQGAEVIHLGHNRSAQEIVEAAIEEDVQLIAITSYQGGHIEFFTYLRKLLDEAGYQHIKIVGGGGGTILPSEAAIIHAKGISKIYLPKDGLELGIEGMIKQVISFANFALKSNQKTKYAKLPFAKRCDPRKLARAITLSQNGELKIKKDKKILAKNIPVIGLTGTGGAGKSTVCDRLVHYFIQSNPSLSIAVVSVDPTKKKTGGALLGDRIRMNAIHHPNVFMRSLATRSDHHSISDSIDQVIYLCKEAGYDAIIVETAGVGQNDASIVDYVTLPMYIMTPEFGAASQLEKINMIDFAQIIGINKFDRSGGLDAIRDVKKQYARSRHLFNSDPKDLPVYGTIASKFNDPGMQHMFNHMIQLLNQQHHLNWHTIANPLPYDAATIATPTIPLNRFNYLNEIVETIQQNKSWIAAQKELASQWYSYHQVLQNPKLKKLPLLKEEADKVAASIDPAVKQSIEAWPALQSTYQQDALVYEIRGKKIQQPLRFQTESGLSLQKVYLPNFKDWGDIAEWQLKENVPGRYPYTAGVFDLKRTGEDPTRMFAGEGGPEKTNQRFHFLSKGQPATRLSTAFDSVTLYGQDPSNRMDVFGKIGNAGVNIASVDDIKKLYSGIHLNDPTSSVSMTINGPAAIILAMFFNAAIDQACEQYITDQKLWPTVNKKINQLFKGKEKPVYADFDALKKQSITHNGLGLKLLGVSGDQVLDAKIYERIKHQVLQNLRGTLQADILKEDQAQNTCIFSIDFALKLMGDVQAYFVDQKIKNFYSISISGYHIAEAGANPITQLAFTLANGFTYIEYFMNRGLAIDEFIPNFSFFFSNGMDPEYAVIGRVARRIWAQTMKLKYKANSRSQKLKYHIQTSGRSLHAQEIDFNDIRTTLQALYAIYDQCNSLHTNAYDEAITTPTKESVRRALAIQLIINKELGTAKVENAQQGSFMMNELTDLVEEAVLLELERINARGGVLGAMERMYQRSKIQEESMLYETRKHHGEIPIIGVNTFMDEADQNSNDRRPVFRSSAAEKKLQISNLGHFKNRHKDQSAHYLSLLHTAAVQNQNIFEVLMEAVKYCSLGDITNLLYHTGGKYSRNL